MIKKNGFAEIQLMLVLLLMSIVIQVATSLVQQKLLNHLLLALTKEVAWKEWFVEL